MVDLRLVVILAVLSGGYYVGGRAVHGVKTAVARIVHGRAPSPHCREFQAVRPADERAITGAAHYCQFDDVDGSIGFTAEACGCR